MHPKPNLNFHLQMAPRPHINDNRETMFHQLILYT